ncbi:MAG: DUF721 domain-containing protein [Syntrophaceae bacterium]|nr:DUF721 domain-containing protein [Syntrophaceae bacterium]
MSKRARQSHLEPLGEILQKILKKRNIPHHTTDKRLLDLWSQAVGQQIAAQTYPACIKRGTLYIRVSASVWLHQLQFLQEEILANLQALTSPEQIRGIYFSIGEIPGTPAQGSLPPPADPEGPLTDRDRRLIRESLAPLEDQELREILERVMAKEIRRRRLREKQQGFGR